MKHYSELMTLFNGVDICVIQCIQLQAEYEGLS